VHPAETSEVDGFDVPRGDRDQIEVADPGIEAARHIGSIQVDPDQVSPEDGAEVRDQSFEKSFRHRIVGVHESSFGVSVLAVNREAAGQGAAVGCPWGNRRRQSHDLAR